MLTNYVTGDKNMNNLNLLLSENPDFKFVTVTFPGSAKEYTYKTFFDVEPEDVAVVKTVDGDFKCVTITSVTPAAECDLNFNFPIKWLVQIVDREAYREAKEMEAKLQAELNKVAAKKQRTEAMKALEENLGQETLTSLKGIVRL